MPHGHIDSHAAPASNAHRARQQARNSRGENSFKGLPLGPRGARWPPAPRAPRPYSRAAASGAPHWPARVLTVRASPRASVCSYAFQFDPPAPALASSASTILASELAETKSEWLGEGASDCSIEFRLLSLIATSHTNTTALIGKGWQSDSRRL